MSTQESEFPDCQERVGLKRKLTGPPRLLLGKSKARENPDGKSQRRQRRHTCIDDTPENHDQQQQDNNAKDNESSHITYHSPQESSEPKEEETQRDAQETLGIVIALEENEGKEENVQNKTGITRSSSIATIKRTFSSLFRCGVRKRKKSHISHTEDRVENKTESPQETKKYSHARKKTQNNMCSSMYENKLSGANNKEANEKGKRNFFFTVWPISKRSSVTSNVNMERGRKEQGDNMFFHEITAPKGLPFKKIYHIFPRKKKTQPPGNQFECCAPKTSQNEEVSDQLNQLSMNVMDIPITHNEVYQKEEQEIKECGADTFTFSADVSNNTHIESSNIDDKQEIHPDQDCKTVLSTMTEEQHQLLASTTEVLRTSGLLDCSDFESELPGTSSGISVGDMLTSNNTGQEKPIENSMKCRPVITIERAYSTEEENLKANANEALQFDVLPGGPTINGAWQHLEINSIAHNTLHPSDLNVSSELDHSQSNETLLIQTAISMVQTAIRGAVEQLAIEQQHNQISLDHA